MMKERKIEGKKERKKAKTRFENKYKKNQIKDNEFLT